MKPHYQKLLFVVNRDKHHAGEIAARLAELARGAGFETIVSDEHPMDPENFSGVDMCCVMGGDGTILGCVKGAAKYDVPIFGINVGKLGFMSAYTDSITDEEFLKAIRGECETEDRTLLGAKSDKGEYMALNEFVIKSANVAGLVTLNVSADGEFVSDFLGDGLIFATPTGSTAYNLSANGPLLHPESTSYVLTSICSHTLSNRSIVFSDTSCVEVKSRDAVLIVDGHLAEQWASETSVKIFASDKKIKFIRPAGSSHFSVLRTKLGWAALPARSGKGEL